MINGINPLGNMAQQMMQTRNIQQEESFEAALEQVTTTKDQEELKEACMEIEQYFLSKIFKQMKTTIETEDPLIPKGDYEKMVEDYLIDEQCRQLCESGGIGLADMMYKQMLRDL